MKLDDVLSAAAHSARAIKTDLVRRGRGLPGECDVPPTVLVFRGNEQVAIIAGGHGRDDSLACARAAAFGFDADTLVHVTDGFSATVETNPVTGRRWAQDEMAQVAAEHDGIAKGWVTEGLFMHALNRAHDLAMLVLPYRVSGRRITWAEPHGSRDGTKGATITGIVPEALRAAMERSGLGVQLGLPAAWGLNPEQAQAHQDVATTKMLQASVPDLAVALLASPGTVRAAIIREEFPAALVVRHGDGPRR